MRVLKLIFFISFCAAVFASGCQSAPRKMNAVEVGMSRREVVLLMGTPAKSYMQENREVLQFNLHKSLNEPYAEDVPYWVFIENGRVIYHGRNQDFKAPSSQEKKEEPLPHLQIA